MVVEQVDFVDVEQSAVRASQDARLKVTLAFLDRLFDIKRSHHAVFRGGDGQVHEGGCAYVMRDLLFPLEAFLAFGAPCVGLVGITAETAVVHNFNFWKQCGKRARRGGFCGAAFAADQHAADAGVNGV